MLPLRAQSTMTTTELRQQDFEFVVAPDAQGTAAGSLYIDDGESLFEASSTQVTMTFKNGRLKISGNFGYPTGVNTLRVRFLSVMSFPEIVSLDDVPVHASQLSYDLQSKVLDVFIGTPFAGGFIVQYM